MLLKISVTCSLSFALISLKVSANFFGFLRALVFGDLSLVSHISFVADQVNHGRAMRVFSDLLNPEADSFEGVDLCCVVNEDNDMHLLVVSFGDGPKAILAACVPHFKLDFVVALGD